MKKTFSFLLLITLLITCFTTPALADSDHFQGNDVDSALEEYLTQWFTSNLSEHLNVSDMKFTFTGKDISNEKLNVYGYVEMTKILKYTNLEDLPFVQGAMDALSIKSMSSIVNGNYNELVSQKNSLQDFQSNYLASYLDNFYSDVQSELNEPYFSTYFFNVRGSYVDDLLTVLDILLEAEGCGYLPAANVLPLTSDQLYDEGVIGTNLLINQSASLSDNKSLDMQTTSFNDIIISPTGYSDYDRVAARDYARDYADNPTESCNCGALNYVSTSSFPSGVTYDTWNETEYPYHSTFCHDDCADFVSQAMSAGGLPESQGSTGWYRTKNVTTSSWSSSWTSVSSMKSYMVNNGYWDTSSWSYCNAGNILLTSSSHVVMVTLNNTVDRQYNGHTNDRDGATISNSSSYLFYSINAN